MYAHILRVHFLVQVVVLVTLVKQAGISLPVSTRTYWLVVTSFSRYCFKVIDYTAAKFQVKLKESMYIKIMGKVKHIKL